MGSTLPFRSFALFRRARSVKRGDVVLVDHPRHGPIVRRVSAVNRRGRVTLRMKDRARPGTRSLDSVAPDRVIGKLALKMKWGRFLPGFSRPRTYPEYEAGESEGGVENGGGTDGETASAGEATDETALPQ